MHEGAFYSQIHVLEQRLDVLRQHVTASHIPIPVLQDAIGELQNTIEELQVTDEELHQQAEELLTTRQALESAHQRYRELFDFAPDSYLVTDMAGTIQEANCAAAALLNVPQARLSGKPLVVFFAPGERQTFYLYLSRLREQLQRQYWEAHVQPLKGAPLPVTVTVVSGKERQGGAASLRWMIRPVSPPKAAEETRAQAGITLEQRAEDTVELRQFNEQLQAESNSQQGLQESLFRSRQLEALGTLAGGIAHEFNNVLAILFGYLDLARMKLVPHAESAASLAEVDKVRPRALALVNKLLAFAPGITLKRSPTVLADLITQAAELALQDVPVTCELSLPADLWRADIDQEHIQQTFQQVLRNAAEAMPQGGTVRVQAHNVYVTTAQDLPLTEGRYVAIAVSDQGSGILPEHCAKIFDPYFTTKEFSRGLGLTVAYAVVSRHGGTMVVNSRIGLGTTLGIYLPASTAPAPPDPSSAGHTAPVKILVMDDEAALRKLNQRLLTSLGYTVDCASDGAEAVALYASASAAGAPYAAVILDLNVQQGMGGKEALAHLQVIDTHVRAIVTSGYATDPVLADFKHYGFSDVLPKPYTPAELQDVLARVLGWRVSP